MESISWNDFKSRLSKEKGLVLTNVDQFSEKIGVSSPTDWRVVSDWEEMDDADLLELFRNIPNDELVVIGEVCYSQNRDPFVVKQTNSVGQFASDYFNEFGESLFNGDVFILGFESNYAGVFHHEGLCYEGELT